MGHRCAKKGEIQMVELLAPAGDLEILKAAVLNGANAVYIGGKEFSARQYASNFEREDVIEAVRFCHAYNAKVYVTLNTLLDNSELKGALEYASFLYSIGVDAIIIQDIGFLKVLRESLPEFEVHGSTQMTAHNLDAVNLLYKMGLKRIVLSRELSLDEIKYIKENTEAEIEVFIHGALCISFSGQCLFSSMIGGRSGNRGRCAQPCRKEYTLNNGRQTHHLSPKDLSTLDFIRKLADIGVDSLKIEGRMKKPEYVVTVVSSYNKALGNNLTEKDKDKVTQVFNRGGFTSAFMLSRQGRDMMSFERPKNWGTYLGKVTSVKGKFASIHLEKTLNVGDGVEVFDRSMGASVGSIKVNGKDTQRAVKGQVAEIYLEGAKKGDLIYKSLDIELVKEAEESYKGKDIKRVPIYGKFTAYKDKNIFLRIENQNGAFVEVSGDEPEIAQKTPTTKERVIDALSKTKDTPFYFENIDIDIDSDIVIPVSKLNNLRRDAIERLLNKLQASNETKAVNLVFKTVNKKIKPKIAVQTGRSDIAKACLDMGCDIIFFGGDKLRTNSGSFSEVKSYAKDKVEVYPWYSEILLEEYEKTKKDVLGIKDIGISKALCGNTGLYSKLKEIGFDVYLDKGFNIFNSKACETYDNIGSLLSQELNLKQLRDVISKTENKVMVNIYGRTKLMVMRHCTIGSSMGHGKKGCPNLCGNNIHEIKDKLGEVFPVITDYYCRNHIYNSKIICMIEHMKDIASLNADYVMLNFIDETVEDAGLVMRAYKDGIDRAFEGDYRVTDTGRELLEKLKGNMTKGHFYRGVM
jgi:U32 family peptidase